MSEITVRRATGEDEKALQRMGESYLSEMSALNMNMEKASSWFFNELAQAVSSGSVVIAENSTGPVAFGAAGKFSAPYDLNIGKTAQILGFWTAPDHRRQGIARKMHEILLPDLAEKGYDAMAFGVHLDNAAGIASAMVNYPDLDMVVGHVGLEKYRR